MPEGNYDDDDKDGQEVGSLTGQKVTYVELDQIRRLETLSSRPKTAFLLQIAESIMYRFFSAILTAGRSRWFDHHQQRPKMHIFLRPDH